MKQTKARNVKINGYQHHRADNAKNLRREEHLERAENWAKLSPAEQLKSLDDRGLTAKKQRARLQKQLEA